MNILGIDQREGLTDVKTQAKNLKTMMRSFIPHETSHMQEADQLIDRAVDKLEQGLLELRQELLSKREALTS